MVERQSIPALEAALGKAKKRIEKLTGERNRLARRLERVDREISDLEGAGKKARRKPGRKRRGPGGPNLGAVVHQVLSEADEPLKVKEITERALARGYRSASKKPVNVVAQYVYKDKNIQRASRGRYALKKSANKSKSTSARKKTSAGRKRKTAGSRKKTARKSRARK